MINLKNKNIDAIPNNQKKNQHMTNINTITTACPQRPNVFAFVYLSLPKHNDNNNNWPSDY